MGATTTKGKVMIKENEELSFEGENLSKQGQISYCETMEAKQLAVIEMQTGLTPFDPMVILDYIEHSEGFRLSDCLSGDDLEKARCACLEDMVYLDGLLYNEQILTTWLN